MIARAPEMAVIGSCASCRCRSLPSQMKDRVGPTLIVDIGATCHHEPEPLVKADSAHILLVNVDGDDIFSSTEAVEKQMSQARTSAVGMYEERIDMVPGRSQEAVRHIIGIHRHRELCIRQIVFQDHPRNRSTV